MTPETLGELAGSFVPVEVTGEGAMDYSGRQVWVPIRDAVLAHAAAWEKQAAEDKAIIDILKGAMVEVDEINGRLRKRLEAAEKALRQIALMTNEMSADGQFTAGDAYYAQAIARAALAGEEKP